ncbi:SPOR domain-containing protein [Bacteroidales bacterium OttesenSCG-928-B11]|nr:SPOR domain-containing protein [Bacteroidales bacterium OttesenSCG-928-B11]MDL2325456.1 SPOR domain-containing protein [Bacteroidales bacterium OttesenSCG-928-A14]
MGKTVIFFIAIFLYATLIPAQTPSVSIEMENGIEEVLALHKAAWTKVKKIDGFRIQIAAISGSHASEKAEKEKENVEKIFKNLPCYISYLEPNFRIRIGDFRTRTEAYRHLETVRLQFPGAFIVTDKIYFNTF